MLRTHMLKASQQNIMCLGQQSKVEMQDGKKEEELRSSGKISSSPPLLQKNHMPKREYRDLNVPKRKIRIFGQ